MLDRADNYLIDHVAQPVVDRLSGKVTVGALAGFLFSGAAVMFVGNMYARFSEVGMRPIDILSGVTLGILFWFWVTAERRNNEKQSGVMPKERLTFRFYRMMWVVLLPISLVSSILLILSDKYGMRYVFHDLQTILESSGLYFLACRQNPPKQRRAEMKIGDLQPVRG